MSLGFNHLTPRNVSRACNLVRGLIPVCNTGNNGVLTTLFLSSQHNVTLLRIAPAPCSTNSGFECLTLSNLTSNLFRQCNFPVSLRCRKTTDTVFVGVFRPLSEPVRRFSSCSTDFSQQIAQVVLFLFLYDFLF
jgi:hypothetical protein